MSEAFEGGKRQMLKQVHDILVRLRSSVIPNLFRDLGLWFKNLGVEAPSRQSFFIPGKRSSAIIWTSDRMEKRLKNEGRDSF